MVGDLGTQTGYLNEQVGLLGWHHPVAFSTQFAKEPTDLLTELKGCDMLSYDFQLEFL